MPPKRKAATDLAPASPKKRATRKTTTENNQTAAKTPKKSTTRSPRKQTKAAAQQLQELPTTPSRRLVSESPLTDRLTSEDELNQNFSPPKQRVVLDCVQITTPTKLTSIYKSARKEGSPTPTAKRTRTALTQDGDEDEEEQTTPTRARRVRPDSPSKQSVPSTPSRHVKFDTLPLPQPGAGVPATPSRHRQVVYDEVPYSPTKTSVPTTPSRHATDYIPSSPTKRSVPPTPSRHAQMTHIPESYHACLNAQKRAILRALQNPPDVDTIEEEQIEDFGPPPSHTAYQQLSSLIQGTVTRTESNSCLLVGPSGSGKSRILQGCIDELKEKPVVIRLSGWAQSTDVLAMREIARQVTLQTGSSAVSEETLASITGQSDDSEDPFIDDSPEGEEEESNNDRLNVPIQIPPAAFLSQLIHSLPSLSRSAIVILDAIDLFALHPRQSLLYCLLDTVQASRPGNGNKGLIVIGVTTRVDTLDLFEKRVKSRFSGRIMRTAPPRTLTAWIKVAKAILCVLPDVKEAKKLPKDWSEVWRRSVDEFFDHKDVVKVMKETFGLSRDVRLLCRLLMRPVLKLSSDGTPLQPKELLAACDTQRLRPMLPVLRELSYPATCLLIACLHLHSAGQDQLTFAMMHESFHTQVRLSTAVPIHVPSGIIGGGGGGIGMRNVSRSILLGALEDLVRMRALVLVSAAASGGKGAGGGAGGGRKEYHKYRCVLDREDVVNAVNESGQVSLKKWLTRASA